MTETWLESRKIAVIGLGYVGLPLAVEFSKKYPVVGFDKDAKRPLELANGHDRTREVSRAELQAAARLIYSSDPADLSQANVYVVTVPTPIDATKQPDLGALRAASRTVGNVLSCGDTVIFESTVFPGCTEEECVPLLEDASGLRFNEDFFVGYSPERINPGDHARRLPDIVKVTSGSTQEAAERIDALYRSIITAGTHLASDIKTAEAAKVIENTQRDLNIALVNELAKIFDRMGIDTNSVLDAAATKWNFINFRPGLVGGHCIGVDPYYLTFKAQALGYNPEVILAGRRTNDGMGSYVVSRLLKEMAVRGNRVAGAKVLILGLTFKENCPDLRNSRVIDIVGELSEYGIATTVWDPNCDPEEARSLYGLEVVEPEAADYDAVILAVAHKNFVEMGSHRLRAYAAPEAVFFDLKGAFPMSASDLRL